MCHEGYLPHLDVPRSKPLGSLQQACQELVILLMSMVDYKYTIPGGRESNLQYLCDRTGERNNICLCMCIFEKETISAYAYAYLKQEAPSNSSFCTFSYSYNSREEGHMFVIMLCAQSVATIT